MCINSLLYRCVSKTGGGGGGGGAATVAEADCLAGSGAGTFFFFAASELEHPASIIPNNTFAALFEIPDMIRCLLCNKGNRLRLSALQTM